MMNDRIDERVEAYVDGSLNVEARREMEAIIAVDSDVRQAVAVARQVRAALKTIETPPCPPEVAAAVFEEIGREHRLLRSRRWSPRFLRQAVIPSLRRGGLAVLRQGAAPGAWRPALAMALALLLVGVAIVVQPWRASPDPAYSSPEVQQALAEVKWTLAYLNGVGSRTGGTIRDEVLADAVVRPMQRGLGLETRRQPGMRQTVRSGDI